MPGERGSAELPSERLARLYFELAGLGNDPRMLEIMHPDVEVNLKKLGGGRTLRGKDEVASFLAHMHETFVLYHATAERFHPVDDDRIVVEGRMRWMVEDRILRDDATIWALEFRDGLLLRSTPARSVGEAQAILSTSAAAARRDRHDRGRR